MSAVSTVDVFVAVAVMTIWFLVDTAAVPKLLVTSITVVGTARAKCTNHVMTSAHNECRVMKFSTTHAHRWGTVTESSESALARTCCNGCQLAARQGGTWCVRHGHGALDGVRGRVRRRHTQEQRQRAGLRHLDDWRRLQRRGVITQPPQRISGRVR